MRDLALVAIVLLAGLVALRRPWVGVMLWTWLSIMNPHRYTYGFAYTAPLAAFAAGCTLLGLAFTRDKSSPFKGAPTVWLALLMVWMSISWLGGLDPTEDYEQWSKVMKIDLMVLVSLALLHSKKHIIALVMVSAGSVALLGVKGGIYTATTGGGGRVWGPPGSFIADNNEFALAVVMTIPLLRFLQLQLESGWKRHAMTLAMLLCAASALGSQSRGALLALSAMALFLWLRSKKKVLGGLFIVIAAAGLVTFMPDSWSDRMDTIKTYESDDSAVGRLDAWRAAWGLAKNYPLGVGFNPNRQELFDSYSGGAKARAAHSVYFQVLGNHGFIGLFLFLALFISTYVMAGRLKRLAADSPQTRWCADLGAMCQVALIAYFVGGAFLSLAYFDLPYNVMVVVVLARLWLKRQAWQTEPALPGNWKAWLGFGPAVRMP